MRSPAIYATSALMLAAACSGSGATAASDAALERDLALASTMTLALPPTPANALMSLETAPEAAPAPAVRPRAAASGPRRVHSRRRSAPSAPVEQPQDVGEAESSLELAGGTGDDGLASTEVAAGGVALPRPVPVSVGLPEVGAGTDDGEWTRGRSGPSVIRGGEIDDCRIHDQRGRRPARRPATSPGMGGSRWPVAQRPPVVQTGGTERQRGGLWGGVTRESPGSGEQHPGAVARPRTGTTSAPRTGGVSAPRSSGTERPRGGLWGSVTRESPGSGGLRSGGVARPRTGTTSAPRTGSASAPRSSGTERPRGGLWGSVTRP